MKSPTKKQKTKPVQLPRFVVYASHEEVTKGAQRATKQGLRSHNEWAGAVLRRELATP